MMKKRSFCIAGFILNIVFIDSDKNDFRLLSSFSPFRCAPSDSSDGNNAAQEPLLTLTVDDNLRPAENRTLIRKFDTGNGDTIVYRLPDGGYQYIIKDTSNRECALLICRNQFKDCTCALNGDWTMRSFGLNDALMLAFAFAGAYHDTLLIHASCILYQDRAYPFMAKSGTGKSTHSALWMKHIEGAELLNDDNPAIRVMDDGKPIVFGTPWSGKTPCYRNRQAVLGALTQIERAPSNFIERLSVVQAFATFLPSCSSMKWDEDLYDRQCTAITRILQTTPVYVMHCLPNAEAAFVCHQTLSAHDHQTNT